MDVFNSNSSQFIRPETNDHCAKECSQIPSTIFKHGHGNTSKRILNSCSKFRSKAQDFNKTRNADSRDTNDFYNSTLRAGTHEDAGIQRRDN